MRLTLLNLLLAIALAASVPDSIRAQQPDTSAPAEPGDTFSGTVVELTSGRMTVSRSVPGSRSERHTFLMKPETHVEGKLKMKARVTVGFSSTVEGDVANLIVVRQTQQKKP